MSVINRVLNDIEQRNKDESEKAAQALEAIDIKEPTGIRSLLFILVTIVLFAAGVYWWFNHSSQVLSTVQHKGVGIEEIEPGKAVIEQQVTDVISQDELVDDKEVEVVEIQKSLVINPPSDLQATSDEQAMIVEVKKTQLSAEQVTIESVPVITKAPVIESSPKQSLSITPVKLSTSELAQLKHQQGIKAYKIGQVEKAQQSWKAALALLPTLHDSRIQLAASYYGENESQQALTLLNDAARQYTNYDGYNLLAAQIYYQMQQPEQALSALNNPYLSGIASEENLVLAASLAQQLKQWPLAQNNYQVLVERQGKNPQWLLGLAIAQDAQNQVVGALNNYQKLLQLTGDQGVFQYAQQRISVLQQDLAQRGNNG